MIKPIVNNVQAELHVLNIICDNPVIAGVIPNNANPINLPIEPNTAINDMKVNPVSISSLVKPDELILIV